MGFFSSVYIKLILKLFSHLFVKLIAKDRKVIRSKIGREGEPLLVYISQTGLAVQMSLQLADTNSNWIWTSEAYDRNQASIIFFRKELRLEQEVSSAIFKISADSRYRLYVNGISIAQGPCKGDGHVWYYDEIDLSNKLRLGVNIFAVVVLRYPQEHDKGNHSVWRTDMPGLYLDGLITLQNEEDLTFRTDNTWRCYHADHIHIGKSNPYFEPLQITEKVKGDAHTFGWKHDGFSDHEWGNAFAYPEYAVKKAVSPGGLSPRPIPFMFEKPCKFDTVVCVRVGDTNAEAWGKLIEEGQLLTIPPGTKVTVEISAGAETTGFLETALVGGRGAKLSIMCSEAYVYQADDLVAYPTGFKKGNRSDFQNGYLVGVTDEYEVGGFGSVDYPEEYEPFWFRTFRFVQITIETGLEPLTMSQLSYRETGYPLEVQTKIETSDPSLSKIWDISERTLRLCMHETYEDCPYYEQLQYAMDSRSQILFTYVTAADDRLARKCIDDFYRSQRYDGLTNSCYPSTGPNVIPGFSIYYILMIHDHMMYFGDRKLVERLLPSVEKVLHFFDNRLDEYGLTMKTSQGGMGNPYWSFVDWVGIWDKGVPNAIHYGPVTFDSLLYRMGLQAAAELANYVERRDLAAIFIRKSEAIKHAVLAHCVGREGLIQDGPGIEEYSQHAQVFAVLTEVVTGSEARKLMEISLSDKQMAKCSVAMSYYLFRALEKVGLYERTDELWNLWRNMLKNNLTTLVEDDVSERSDCHAWGAVILHELPAVILGVRPAEPGYASVRISPIAGYLTWAKGEVITPHGLIKVTWAKDDNGEIDINVVAPKEVRIV